MRGISGTSDERLPIHPPCLLNVQQTKSKRHLTQTPHLNTLNPKRPRIIVIAPRRRPRTLLLRKVRHGRHRRIVPRLVARRVREPARRAADGEVEDEVEVCVGRGIRELRLACDLHLQEDERQ